MTKDDLESPIEVVSLPVEKSLAATRKKELEDLHTAGGHIASIMEDVSVRADVSERLKKHCDSYASRPTTFRRFFSLQNHQKKRNTGDNRMQSPIPFLRKVLALSPRITHLDLHSSCLETSCSRRRVWCRRARIYGCLAHGLERITGTTANTCLSTSTAITQTSERCGSRKMRLRAISIALRLRSAPHSQPARTVLTRPFGRLDRDDDPYA
jgi:hypothetical protein